ncbi:MAG: DUF4293 domain-containing protein [Chitinophagales bacterium]|nr:DUF4293 domain-containing protein [Chitinophagaceae bacterium]MCB9065318.1 DUF4293 domain-containing protein [Chitinophagales bacterium]
MIQRIQSLWLLVAALFNAGLFYFSLYKADVMNEGVASMHEVTAGGNILLFLLAIVIVALPLVTIFMFKNRKQQSNLAKLSIVLNIGFIAAAIMVVTNFSNGTPTPTNGSYRLGMVLPIASLVILLMAYNAIRKDIKTIKSLDRLR